MSLSENNKLLSLTGVIGPQKYFQNLVMAFAIGIIPKFLPKMLSKSIPVTAIFIVIALSIVVSLMVRRLRDIKREQIRDFQIVILIFLIFVPVINIFYVIYLGLKKRVLA